MTKSDKVKFSPNSSIDMAIKELLPYFSLVSQLRMRKAILAAKKSAEKHRDENTDAGARHIFREFIPAYILNQKGFAFEYEKSIFGKKPDWVDESASLMLDSYTFERGGTSSFMDRVTSVVTDKCSRYEDIFAATSLHFFVFVYIDFLTGILLDECREDARVFRSIFGAHPFLFGIVFFTEKYFINRSQDYEFLCLCPNSYFKTIPNWPFETIDLSQ